MNFDSLTGEFTAIVKIDTRIQAPTVLYLHKDDDFPETLWYPNGYTWTVEPTESGPTPDIEILENGGNICSFIIKNDDFMGLLVKI